MHLQVAFRLTRRQWRALVRLAQIGEGPAQPSFRRRRKFAMESGRVVTR